IDPRTGHAYSMAPGERIDPSRTVGIGQRRVEQLLRGADHVQSPPEEGFKLRLERREPAARRHEGDIGVAAELAGLGHAADFAIRSSGSPELTQSLADLLGIDIDRADDVDHFAPAPGAFIRDVLPDWT